MRGRRHHRPGSCPMFRLFDLFRRRTKPAPRRAPARRLGLENLEGRAAPAGITLSDVLVSSYESASRVSTNDFHFVQSVNKASPALSLSPAQEGATSPTVALGSQSTGAGAGKVTFNPF